MRHRLLTGVMMLSSLGCLSPIDREWATVNATARQGNQVFGAVARSYARCADELAGKKHELQALHLERDWADFVRIHTNAAGRLVSLDAAGQEQPLRVEDLQAAVAARDAKLAAIAASRASWASVHEPFAAAVATFDAMTESTAATEGKILEAKASAQAFLDAALSAIGGVAAGVFTGAAGVP